MHTVSPVRRTSSPSAARASEPKREVASKPKSTESAPKKARNAADRWDKGPSVDLKNDSPAELAAAWAAYFPESKVVPKVGERGTVGGFSQAQIEVLHELFWSAPPGAEDDDIAKLASGHKAFKGHGKVDPEALSGLARYRPESFPFPFSDRKRSFCSFIAVEGLLATPSDVAGMTVLKDLRQQFDGFIAEVSLAKFARTNWVKEPDIFPFAKRLPRSKEGEGYAVASQAEVVGLPRWGGKLALSAKLAHQLSWLLHDPRVRYGMEFEDVLALASKDLGEPFTLGQWKHLREEFPDLPDANAILGEARKRFAHLIRNVCREQNIASGVVLAKVLHEDFGFPLYNSGRFVSLREEFPALIPVFRDLQSASLADDAQEFLKAIKAAPKATYDEAGASIGLAPERVRAVLRWVDVNEPGALKIRRGATKPFTAEEKKWLKQVDEGLVVGARGADLYKEFEAQHPGVLASHGIESSDELLPIAREALGIENWKAHQRNRLEALIAQIAGTADAGVSLAEITAHLRDEFGAQVSYTLVKSVVRAAEYDPQAHPTLAALMNDSGRFPWNVGFSLTKSLAQEVAQAIKTHADEGLHACIASLMKDPDFKAKYPTFGTVHVAKLRLEFPDIVPYLDDWATPSARRETRAWTGELDALAKKAEAAVDALEEGVEPSIAVLSRALRIKETQIRRAILRHPEHFPWYRKRPTGNMDLGLAYRVAAAMEAAPLEATLSDLAKTLTADKDFKERYPSFDEKSITALRDTYPDIVPSWHTRHQMLRSVLLADALREAPEGTSFDKVVAGLEKQHPGAFDGAYKVESFVRGLWAAAPDDFPFAADFKGKKKLQGLGLEKVPTDETPSQVAARAARLAQVPKTLPLIETIVDSVKNQPLDSGQRYEFVLMQHLLDTQIPTLDALKRLGMSPARTTVVGVPYSASDLVVDELRDDGWDVRVPPLDLHLWEEDVRAALHERLAAALKHHRDILVMDDGGLVAKLVAHDPVLKEHAAIFRIVEQTRRGITVADEEGALAPVVNVAQSWGKFVEGPMIADSVIGKLVGRLEKVGVSSFKGKKVGVIGAGTIGLPIALELKKLGADVTVLDPSTEAQKDAKKSGLKLAGDRGEFFGAQDIIIGATGIQSITADDLPLLKDGAIIGSASSKLVEIDVGALADLSRDSKRRERSKIVDDESHPPSLKYTLAKGRDITLLGRGYPVNFDGLQENIPPEQIQLTRALMVLALLQAADSKVPGVKRLEPEAERQLLAEFEKLGGADVTPQVRKVFDEAIKELDAAIAKPGTGYRRRDA